MSKILAAACLSLFFVISSRAQEPARANPASAVRYHNRTSTGVLLGDGNAMGSFTTVHGIGYRHWSVGIGSGLEGSQRWRTVPLFGSATFHFRGHANSGMFLQFNAGHSFGKLLMIDQGFYLEEAKGGPMINPMIGYQVSTGKIIVFLAAGYKGQRMAGTYMSFWSVRYAIEDKMDRFLFQIGVGFL